ncbi:hypothetical protein GP2143_05170 [marine gamma proteobacterium HTCC2143]|uniref:Uncharacterized protein n=1 Tax=marine gamma proteobacterium HTCC2143 TaxID=247633 RepID=A0YB84_9GAMM|nr:hypothetical protein GP2143_05170 [marine gamma proteobacterium HTCC2143]
MYSVPNIDTVFYSDSISNDCATFNKAMRANIAVIAYNRVKIDDTKLPNGGVIANVFTFYFLLFTFYFLLFTFYFLLFTFYFLLFTIDD